MKKLVVLVVLIALAASVYGNDSVSLAKHVLAAIKNNDTEGIKKLVMPPEVYRRMYPKETGALSDAEIKAKTCDNPKIKTDLKEIQKQAKEKKVELKDLEYIGVQMENEWETDEGPWSLSVNYMYEGKEGGIFFSAIWFEGQWYFMEFQFPGTAFREF